MIVNCECGASFEADEMPRRGPVCFKCHVRGVSFGFRGGGTYGRKAFSATTNKEVRDEIVREGRANGYDPQPVGARWV